MPEHNSENRDASLRRDRFRGALAGAAIGSVLGMAAQGGMHYPGGGMPSLETEGETDAAELLIICAESLCTRRIFDPEDMAGRMVNWLNRAPAELEAHTRTVLLAIQNGELWSEAAFQVQSEYPDSAGNGSLPRVPPAALFFASNPQHLTALAPLLSTVTHAHPDCQSACQYLAILLALLAEGAPHNEAVDQAENYCTALTQPLKDRLKRARLAENRKPPTVSAIDTLGAAVWTFQHLQTPRQMLLEITQWHEAAVCAGCITGALAGAAFGYAALPENWINSLKNLDYLIELSDILLELADRDE